MKAIDPSELSALLDGELTAQRSAEIRAAIASNAALRAEFNELSRCDLAWKEAARSAVFQPQTTNILGWHSSGKGLVWIALGLLCLRMVLKIVPLSSGLYVQMIVMALLAAWMVRWCQRIFEASRTAVGRHS